MRFSVVRRCCVGFEVNGGDLDLEQQRAYQLVDSGFAATSPSRAQALRSRARFASVSLPRSHCHGRRSTRRRLVALAVKEWDVGLDVDDLPAEKREVAVL